MLSASLSVLHAELTWMRVGRPQVPGRDDGDRQRGQPDGEPRGCRPSDDRRGGPVTLSCYLEFISSSVLSPAVPCFGRSWGVFCVSVAGEETEGGGECAPLCGRCGRECPQRAGGLPDARSRRVGGRVGSLGQWRRRDAFVCLPSHGQDPAGPREHPRGVAGGSWPVRGCCAVSFAASLAAMATGCIAEHCTLAVSPVVCCCCPPPPPPLCLARLRS